MTGGLQLILLLLLIALIMYAISGGAGPAADSCPPDIIATSCSWN